MYANLRSNGLNRTELWPTQLFKDVEKVYNFMYIRGTPTPLHTFLVGMIMYSLQLGIQLADVLKQIQFTETRPMFFDLIRRIESDNRKMANPGRFFVNQNSF